VGDGGDEVLIRFEDAATGRELLAEQRGHFWWPGARAFHSLGGGRGKVEQHFRAYDDERLFGMGQRPNGRLDQKGMTLDLLQRNSEVCIPFLVSSRGYGFLWNNPAVGHVELAENRTRWVADAARQVDYWVTAGDPAAIMSQYADVTGHAPVLPEWASGFWQSKLRYRTQDELLAVAREYKRRQLPLSVIVIDFFHWAQVGNWKFDPKDWPDPKAMVDELAGLGVKVMVSVWPLVSPFSENWDEMYERGLLVDVQQGLPYTTTFPDRGMPKPFGVGLYDPTNPEARAFVWSKVKQNYFDIGIKVWWLDACEPELRPVHPSLLRLRAGEGDEIINIYPQMHARTFYEGMHAAGDTEVVLLARSAWAGSQRYGAAVWPGDIPTSFDSLHRQIRAGLNIAMSGIPWWTTDIGGFHGGDPTLPEYRELVIRWFEYGVFCPLFRIHGDRLPRLPFGPNMTGSANEVWAFGDEAYKIISDILALRERIRPYLMEQMRVAHETGLPPMRPLFVDFPADARSWQIEDEFMLGPDVLVAPIDQAGSRERDVYLPPGAWVNAWTGVSREGGSSSHEEAPLNRIPVFVRKGASVPIAG
jgi:alpha-D-xyloside xylohydrolase